MTKIPLPVPPLCRCLIITLVRYNNCFYLIENVATSVLVSNPVGRLDIRAKMLSLERIEKI